MCGKTNKNYYYRLLYRYCEDANRVQADLKLCSLCAFTREAIDVAIVRIVRLSYKERA